MNDPREMLLIQESAQAKAAQFAPEYRDLAQTMAIIGDMGATCYDTSEFLHASFADAIFANAHAGLCAPRPADVEQGEMRQCYANALHLSLERGWLYCEGWAQSLMGLEHAWCIDDDGNVVDPTWDDTVGGAYIGVPMAASFALQLAYENDRYGVFTNDYRRGYRILRHGFVTEVDPTTGLRTAVGLGGTA